MPTPRPLSEADHQGLTDEELFARLVACRDAGLPDQAELAMWFVLARTYDDVVTKLEAKLPPDVAEEQATVVITRAIGSRFDGEAPAQLRKWLNVIIARVIADYWRGKEGRQLGQDREGARLTGPGEDGGPQLPEPPVDEHGYDLVDHLAVVGPVLAARSAEHRAIVAAFLFEDRPAKDVAAAHGTTVDNVNQVVSRFRKDCLKEDS